MAAAPVRQHPGLRLGRAPCGITPRRLEGAVDTDRALWDKALAINLTSMVLMARHAIPAMAPQGRGAIVNMASVAGLLGSTAGLAYQASKGAVVNLTRAMATQHAAQGIRVNCVAPGMVYTPMASARGMAPEVREARRQRSLLQVEGTGWDVGEAVAFLASDAARWITGVVLPVDAGTSATSVRAGGVSADFKPGG